MVLKRRAGVEKKSFLNEIVFVRRREHAKKKLKILEVGEDPEDDSCMETNAGGHQGTLAGDAQDR